MSQELKGLKTCPQCGAQLFEDLDICYGCLYSFEHPPTLVTLPDLDDLDEPSDGCAEGFEVQSEAFDVALEDTCDLLFEQNEPSNNDISASRGFVLMLEDPMVRVPLYVPKGGLTFGRDRANDVVISDPRVSRRHIWVKTSEHGMVFENLGATNPARYLGNDIEDTIEVPAGGVVELGYALLRVEHF